MYCIITFSNGLKTEGWSLLHGSKVPDGPDQLFDFRTNVHAASSTNAVWLWKGWGPLHRCILYQVQRVQDRLVTSKAPQAERLKLCQVLLRTLLFWCGTQKVMQFQEWMKCLKERWRDASLRVYEIWQHRSYHIVFCRATLLNTPLELNQCCPGLATRGCADWSAGWRVWSLRRMIWLEFFWPRRGEESSFHSSKIDKNGKHDDMPWLSMIK